MGTSLCKRVFGPSQPFHRGPPVHMIMTSSRCGPTPSMRNQTLSTRLRAVQRRAGLIDGFCAQKSFSAPSALPSRRRPRSPRRTGVDLRLRRAPLDSTRSFSSPNLTPALEPTRTDCNRRSPTTRPTFAASHGTRATRGDDRLREQATARGRRRLVEAFLSSLQLFGRFVIG